MAHLRVARANDREDIPLHFEGVMLAKTVHGGAWVMGLALVVGGIIAMVSLAGSWIEIPAAVAAALGALVLFVAIRCQSFEITVGRQWLKTRMGPFKNDLARSLIKGVKIRESTSWRRLYADKEIVIALDHGEDQPVLPSSDAEELVFALKES